MSVRLSTIYGRSIILFTRASVINLSMMIDRFGFYSRKECVNKSSKNVRGTSNNNNNNDDDDKKKKRNERKKATTSKTKNLNDYQ
jgi:hypothetical protein